LPITITQALDLPVAVVLLMFIPIGLWRGALREWVACAGIALGLLLADGAGTRWGEGFAQFANMDPKLGTFAVATAFFLASVLLIGYGGGLALPYRPDLSWPNRALGALLGLGNGFLIVGGLLRLMQARLFDGRSNSPLHTATLAAFLIDASIVWVYLGLFLSLWLCVILGLITRVNDGTPLFEEYGPVYQVTSQGDWASAARWESQGSSTETWSAEAEAASTAPQMQQTQVLQLVSIPSTATANAPTNGATPAHKIAKQSSRPIADLARPESRPAASTPASLDEQTGNTDRVPLTAQQPSRNDAPTLIPRPVPPATETRQQREIAPPKSAAPAAGCPICNASLATKARFCGNCGHIIGAAERRQIARQR